jgi:hypothetical protein
MLSFLMVIVVAILAAVVFTVWVIITGTRSLWRLVAGQVAPPRPDTAGGPRCNNSGCGTINPAQARFCRRCGSAMGSAVQAPTFPRADRSRSVA